MPRPPLPKVLADVFDDRQARATLLAGAFALFAAGLDPKVWGPSLSTVQAAIRERPSLEAYVLLGAVGSAILLLVGGAIGDLRRARPLIVGGLATLVVTGTVGLLVPSGPVFIAARLIGAAAAALTVPASLASVALAYRGVARATAHRHRLRGVRGRQRGHADPADDHPRRRVAGVRRRRRSRPSSPWSSFAAGSRTSSGRGASSGPTSSARRCGRARSSPSRRASCGWAAAGTTPCAGRSSGSASRCWSPTASWEVRRRAAHPADLQVDRRPVTVALFAGVVIAIAQSAPMLILPQYFAIVPRFGPVFGMLAIAPLIAGLVIAGPVAGYLLARFPPRVLVAAGLVTVGLGNLGGRAAGRAGDRLRAVHPAAAADRRRVRRRARPCGRRSSSPASRAACPRPRRRSTRPRSPSATGSASCW